MSSTDDRIVRMQFDNAAFKKGAADTQKSLADLNKATDSAGKGKGLLDLNGQMQTVGVTASKMAIVTTTAIATIAHKAVESGIQLAKSMTLDPIREGFLEYESLLTKQNVIMNATGLSARVVKGYLNELNTYSDQTIYSFSNMTDSITKFVNAGVDMPTAVTSIKGIANAAAFAGASTQEANRAMYAFSQSMQTGFIMLNDWMQIENANMGTIAFKEELLNAAVAAGTLTRKGKEFVTQSGTVISATKGWRDGLQDQWATTEVLNATLGKYADQTTKLGKTAFKSATEVRTFSAFMDTLKESIGSGWASIFTSLIGNLKQATSFWTGVADATSATVGAIFEFGVTALKTWRKMGGFEKVMEGLSNLMAPFRALLSAVGDAWKEAFPGTSSGAGKALYGLSAAFALVTSPLEWLAKLIRGTTPVLTVFFQVLKVGGTVIGRAAGMIGDFVTDLLGLVNLKPPSGGGFLGFIKDIARAIADAVGEVDALLSKGASLTQAFGSVDVKLPSMPSLPSLPSFSGGEDGAVAGMAGGIKGLTQDVLGLNRAADDTETKFMFNSSGALDTSVLSDYGKDVSTMASEVSNSGDQAKAAAVKMGDVLSAVGSAIGNFISNFSFQDLLEAFNMALLASFMISLVRILHTFSKGFSGFMGIGDAIQDTLMSAGSALQSFQTNAKAKLILNIAIAIGILAAALLVLSLIPAKRLAVSLGALVITMYALNKMMTGLIDTLGDMEVEKIAKVSGALFALGFAMMSLGVALLFIATAMVIFNAVDMDGFLMGITTMIVMITSLTLFAKFAGEATKQLYAVAFAMMAVGGAMLLLAAAMLVFNLVSWESMLKAGLVFAAMGVGLLILGKVPWPMLAAAGLAMFAIAAGMMILANALILFGLVKWESIAKAAVVLLTLVAALLLLSIFGNPVTTGGFVALAVAMLLLSVALLALNNVDWSSIGKLAVVFVILTVAMAAFLAVISFFALAIPLMLLFGVALLAMGVGMLAFAAAMAIAVALGGAAGAAFIAMAVAAAFAITGFLQTLAQQAPIMKEAFLKILQTLIDTIVEAVPMVINGIKRLFNAIAKEFSSPDKGKKVGDAGKGWIERLGDAIKKQIPMIVKKGSEILIAFLRALASKMGAISAAGVSVLVSFINGIGKKIGDVVVAATDLIIKFAKGLQEGLDRIVKAGIELIAEFLHDLADAIRNGSSAIGGGLADVLNAFADVGRDMVQGIINGIGDMFNNAMDAIGNLASGMVNKAKNILDIFSPSKVFKNIGKFLVQGLTKGIQDNAASAIAAVASMVSGQIAVANEYVNKFIQKLDQAAIAARAKAEGLARAALKAEKAANKTKTKQDDKAANRLFKAAERARKKAEEAEKKAENAEKAEDRAEKFQNSSLIEKAKIRSGDAQRQLDAAKSAEQNAAALRIEAKALEAEAKKEGYTAKQRAEFRKEAERLRKEAREQAKKANKQLKNAEKSAEEALKYQRLAGEEAAKLYQEQFDAEAKADAEAERFEKLSDAEKAVERREAAAKLEKKAAENLKKAKELALTDLAAANKLAQDAMAQADLARQYIDEAVDFEKSGGGGPAVDLQITDAAAKAFAQYTDTYDAAVAAAAGTNVNFNQYNTSPESLSPAEIYRNTHNQLTFAADKLAPSAA